MNTQLCKMLLLTLVLQSSLFAQTVDPVFNRGPGADNFVEQVLPLPDGKVLICGMFTQYNNEPAKYVTRLNEDGTLDRTWNADISGWVRHMVLQPDGKVVIGGSFQSVEGILQQRIARLNSNGTLDKSFNTGAGFEDKLTPSDPNPPYVFWMDRQEDGKIVVVGSFARFNGQIAKGIARLNMDGSLDTSFKMGAGFDSWGRFVKVQPDQSILATGWMTSYNGFGCNRMVRIKPDGTPDTTFRPYFGDKTSIYSAAALGGGRMIVSGHSKNEQGLFHEHVRMLNADGSVNNSLQASTDERTESVLVLPDGKIILSGWFRTVNNTPRSSLARLHPDGRLDPDFKADADNYIWSTALDAKGRLLVSGGFVGIKGQARRGVARLILNDQSATSLPKLLNPRYSGEVFRAGLQTQSGRTYVLQFCDDLNVGTWKDVSTVQGTGNLIELEDSASGSALRCYRVRIQ